ncbi:cupin domain-containing protein [Roseomonas sp. HJA6]|uniref:Cupin domain-containing protein n=1 Tax=Roseomonas alba TaxID=2846776 RepID=A0ABS7AFR0_9PROT|nr:cupin domain-containing protein [Neoroseomonas alba]MBW6401144.1 cupin domain-containing protein [Neoroseomonas alba]
MAATTTSHAKDAHFERGLRAFFEYRDLGIRQATEGAFGAHVIRAIPGEHATGQWHTHDLPFQMFFVLKGWVKFEYEDIGEKTFQAGDCCYQPRLVRHREIDHSEDVEILEITGPAEFETKNVPAPEKAAAAE